MGRSTSVIVIAALAVAGAACSAENAAESLIENAIESESGGEVDLDFNDDGSFSIETEDGSMALDEEGNFVITDENGEVITGDVNVDGNGIDINSEDGNFSMESDDDGTVVIESDDGSMTIESGTEIPEQWPSDVPQPTGLVVNSATNASSEGFVQVSVSGASDLGEAWATGFGEQLLQAGFAEVMKVSSPDGIQVGYGRDDENVSILGFAAGNGGWDLIVSYTATEG